PGPAAFPSAAATEPHSLFFAGAVAGETLMLVPFVCRSSARWGLRPAPIGRSHRRAARREPKCPRLVGPQHATPLIWPGLSISPKHATRSSGVTWTVHGDGDHCAVEENPLFFQAGIRGKISNSIRAEHEQAEFLEDFPAIRGINLPGGHLKIQRKRPVAGRVAKRGGLRCGVDRVRPADRWVVERHDAPNAAWPISPAAVRVRAL